MKKLCFILLVSAISCSTVISAQSDDKFINALRTCSPSYRESDTVNVNGISALSNKSLSGWHNDKCTYTETVKINDMNITTTCNFTKPQINEITKVADAYFLTLKYGTEKADTSSLDAVQNNPVFNVMNKYLQNPSVCSLSGM